MNDKLNLIELEALRTELLEKVFNGDSISGKLSYYFQYFQKILQYRNPNISEAFLKEFIEDYFHLLNKFEVWGVKPEISKTILLQIKEIQTLKIAEEIQLELDNEIERIENQLIKLDLILGGKEISDGLGNKAYFPLIDQKAPPEFYGIIDSVSIKLSKGNETNKPDSWVGKFIIVPSEIEIEKRINEQCENSWNVALHLASRYIKKPYSYHEVIISFDKKIGFYEGNSLGIALTLSFLEQLLKFYNPAYIININERSAFTGGVNSEGKILVTGEEIIKQKVSAVFFSEINSFVIPKYEETYAYFALTQLKKDYPNRTLKLIPVEDINDVINRRDLVDIKKRNPVVRTGKFVKKNWISAVATILLVILFGYLFVMDFDDNPALLTSDGSTLYVKNKNGNLLWTKSVSIGKDELVDNLHHSKTVKIVDINNDGQNEVLISNEQDIEENDLNTSCYLKCYDKYQKLIWKFNFTENVISKREKLEPFYNIYMLDTLTVQNKNSIFVFVNNSSSFSSAVFSIDLKTGKKNAGTIWCSGHTYDGMIKDINGDKRKDLFCLGLDNGFEDVVLFGAEIDSINIVRPTTDDYLINNYPISDFISYIRIQKNDYDVYTESRFNAIGMGSFNYLSDENKYYFPVLSGKKSDFGIWYKLDKNLNNFEIIVDNQFRILRDTLVAHGKLNKPYTDSEEYKNIIKDNILYFKSGLWVKRTGLD